MGGGAVGHGLEKSMYDMCQCDRREVKDIERGRDVV